MLHTDTPAAAGSPDWVCRKLDRALACLYDLFFAGLKPWALALAAACVSALLFLEAHFSRIAGETRLDFFGEFSPAVKQRFGLSAFILICAVIFFQKWPQLVRRTGAMLLLTAVAALSFEARDSYWNALLEVALPAAIVIGATYAVYFTRRWPIGRQMMVFGAFLLLAFFYQSFTGLPRPRLLAFNNVLMTAVVLFSLRASLVGEFSPRSLLLYTMSPLHLFYALPIESSAWPDRSPKISKGTLESGLASICGGGVLLILAGLWHTGLMFTQAGTVLSFLWRGWTNFIFYYLGWLAYLHIAVGLARWLGFGIGKGAYHSLLSPDPLSRWKRWNYFYYWFYLSCVWLPVARKTGSYLLGITAVWMLNYFLHNRVSLNEFLSGPVDPIDMVILKENAIFFCGHAAVIYLAFATKSLWPSGASLRGWLGVGLTHLLMASIHGVLVLA